MKITEGSIKIELSWSDMCKIIGAKVDGIDNIEMSSFGGVEITVDAESSKQVRDNLEKLIHPSPNSGLSPSYWSDRLATCASEAWKGAISGSYSIGGKINAVKRVREMMGCGLKEAKDWVELNLDTNGNPNSAIYPSPF